MLLYHGSNTDIKEINLAMCRPFKLTFRSWNVLNYHLLHQDGRN